jgi:hypothetical protein
MGVRFLADGLRGNSSLQSFRQGRRSLRPAAGQGTPCFRLPGTPALPFESSFSDNIGTGDAGASAFAEALRNNRTLLELKYVYAQPGEPAARSSLFISRPAVHGPACATPTSPKPGKPRFKRLLHATPPAVCFSSSPALWFANGPNG